MYIMFRVIESGDIECYQVSHWIVHKDGIDVWTLDDDLLEYRKGRATFLGYEVEVLEMVPDARRFVK